MIQVQTIQTGSTLVSSAVPNRATHRWAHAYTGLFQCRKNRIEVPVKCFYVTVGKHHLLVDTGWSKLNRTEPLKHLGFGLWFASEPVLPEGEAACEQLAEKPIDAILMTHVDCDHISGLFDFSGIDTYTSAEEITFAKRNRLRYGGLDKGHTFRTIPFVADEAALFGKSCDLFGDGTVVAYLTPTHSAGSVIYKIQDGDRFALIVGDNGYNHASWQQGLLPGPLYDADNMRKCLAWLKEQEQQPACLGIFCAHDPQMMNVLK